jgi:replicative DNA helicase
MELTNNPECQVLGALLLDPDYIFQIQEVLSEDDFASSRHRKIFKAILTVGENCDVFTVADELGDIDENIIYLSDMTDSCPTSKNVLAYAQVVLESGRQRKLRALSQMILESQQSKEKSEVILDKLGEALSLISTNAIGNTQTTLNEALKEVVAQVSERMEGVGEVYKTGFDELDEYMPFEAGKLYLLGGLSGMGKSSLLQALLENQIFNGIPCYFNSAEMSSSQVAKRFLQSAGGIRSGFFKDPAKQMNTQNGERMTAGLIKLKDRNLLIDDQQGLTVEQLKVRARNWITSQKSYQETGKAILAIDYAQLLDYDHRNSSSSLGKISKELRSLGKELGIPVILLVQMNNDYKTRTDKRPIPSDIAGSSEMYKDSDGVIFCYRDIVFNEDTPDKDIMEVIIGKNRDDAQGTVRVLCELAYFRISDIKNKY